MYTQSSYKKPTVITLIYSIGLILVRRGSSHIFLKHHGGRTTVVPDHCGKDIDRGLLNKIIKKDLNITR
ncbi:MAG: type II toxin-antitoxin system HicA family toxin [Candidatus Altiarchaeota archaeon]|nr:type II toxin-antitoxin system HicA family toxin [Candidatus Altiarchaeota archaeon]